MYYREGLIQNKGVPSQNMVERKKDIMKHVVYSIVGFFVVMCLLTSPAFASSALMTDVQYWLAPDHIQTIIEFDRTVQPTYHRRKNPERFVLEIPNCQITQRKQTIVVNDITLQRIRVQRLNNGTTQVVFDLSQEVEATVQTLTGIDGQPDRIVVNLFDKTTQEKVEPKQVERQKFTRPFQKKQQYILVLDPGHGGRDPGAVGPNGLFEKTIVLDLAKRMQKILRKKAPHITVHLTRDSDYFLTLPKRTEIAQNYHADLFVSLHVNANHNKKTHGFSVYTLSEKATDEAARKLAEQENAVDVLFGGMETPTPVEDGLLTFVLADLSTTAALQHSLEFGQMAVDRVIANLKKFNIRKEGLKRANFAVLRSADMPAVLVEACYISNKQEVKLLQQNEFRDKIAHSLSSSIIEYFDRIGFSERPKIVKAAQDSKQSFILAHNPTQQTAYKMHVVKSGESLSEIAGKYNVKLTQLRKMNQLTSADLIYIGQQLWIP